MNSDLGLTDILMLVASIMLAHGLCDLLFFLSHGRLVRRNFQHRLIPTAFGGVVPVAVLFFFMLQVWLEGDTDSSARQAWLFFQIPAVGFGLLGLIDDLFGNRKVGGLKGHFAALVMHGKLTTGTVKAIGGVVLAALIAYRIGIDWPNKLVNAVLIAGSANALNLFDTRPGRCLFAGLIGIIPPLLIALHATGWNPANTIPPLFVLMVIVSLYPAESRGKAMLGDTGSNSIGAMVGVSWAIWLPLPVRILGVAWLIVLHAWTERHSISKLIESSRLLVAIDGKLGVR